MKNPLNFLSKWNPIKYTFKKIRSFFTLLMGKSSIKQESAVLFNQAFALGHVQGGIYMLNYLNAQVSDSVQMFVIADMQKFLKEYKQEFEKSPTISLHSLEKSLHEKHEDIENTLKKELHSLGGIEPFYNNPGAFTTILENSIKNFSSRDEEKELNRLKAILYKDAKADFSNILSPVLTEYDIYILTEEYKKIHTEISKKQVLEEKDVIVYNTILNNGALSRINDMDPTHDTYKSYKQLLQNIKPKETESILIQQNIPNNSPQNVTLENISHNNDLIQ